MTRYYVCDFTFHILCIHLISSITKALKPFNHCNRDGYKKWILWLQPWQPFCYLSTYIFQKRKQFLLKVVYRSILSIGRNSKYCDIVCLQMIRLQRFFNTLFVDLTTMENGRCLQAKNSVGHPQWIGFKKPNGRCAISPSR